jgi:hypothetical protein
VNIEDFPLLWISDNYYDTFKDNTFTPVGTDCIEGGKQADYDVITEITLGSFELTTAFTVTLLEKFKNLTVLELSDNDISIIEIPAVNKLEEIKLANNDIGVFNPLNLTKATAVAIQGNRITGHLDFSNCVNMDSCICNSNRILSFDFTNCTELTRIRAYGAQMILSNVDISDCTIITNINFKNSSLESIDFANNSLLNSIELENTQLTAELNSMLLVQLDGHGQLNGYFESSIFGGGSLTAAGLTAKSNLQAKNWNILGI